MIKISKNKEKITPAKTTITLDGIYVTSQVGFKISIELPSEDEE